MILVAKTVALLRLLETARENNNTIILDDFERVTQDFGAHDKLNFICELLIFCGRRGIEFVEEYAAINIIGKTKTFFDCTEDLSKTALSRGGKLSWSELDTTAQRFGLNDAATIDKLSTFCQRAGIQLTNEPLAPVVDETVKPSPEIDLDELINKLLSSNVAEPVEGYSKTVAALIDEHKRNGGRLTWEDFARIVQSFDKPVNETEPSNVNEAEPSPVNEAKSSPVNEAEPSNVNETEPSPVDEIA